MNSNQMTKKEKGREAGGRIGPTVKQKPIKSDFTTVMKFISLLLSFNLIRYVLTILKWYPPGFTILSHLQDTSLHCIGLHITPVLLFRRSHVLYQAKKTIAEGFGFIYYPTQSMRLVMEI